MRILHIFNEINFSGAEIMYANAASLFQDEGFELLALSTGEKLGNYLHQFEAESIEVHHMKLPIREYNPFYLVYYFKKVYRFVKSHNIDVIHIHRSRHFLFFSLVGFLANVKTIRTVHNVFKHRKWTWIKGCFERLVARKFLNVTFQTIGESVYNNELNYYKNKSILIDNWFDNKRFYKQTSVKEREVLRKKLQIASNAYVVISTGGCSNVKNHHDIIRALKIVNEKIDCTYLHLGEGVTTEEEKQLSINLGVDNKIRFLGNRNNVRDYLIASDLYLMPSRFEGLAIAAIEAMACEKSSVLYNVVGLKDLIKDNNNGFLISESYTELADKILFSQANSAVTSKMAENAAKFVKEKFSIEKGVSNIIKLYRS
jgi:glycosyltransferase involved in cell wall biosynthesis